MDIEKLIAETLTAREHDVPDPGAVLAGARRRIDRGRLAGRPVAVAAGVAALTAAAAGVVAVDRSGAGDDTARGDLTAAGPVRAAAPAVADLTMPYTLGWLPPGEVDERVHRINTGATAEDPDAPVFGGEYMLTVTSADRELGVDVQEMRMMPLADVAFKSGPGSPVTVGGRPGVESSLAGGPGGYELYVEHPGGGTMYVNVHAGHGTTVPAADLTAAGRRIAENIRFPGTTTVTPAFGLGGLPDGLRMCTFGVERDVRTPEEADTVTSYSVGTCTTTPGIHLTSAAEPEPAAAPGQPVQGHATRHHDDGGYHRVWVLDAVDGAAVVVAGAVPPARLYAIADGLVLPD